MQMLLIIMFGFQHFKKKSSCGSGFYFIFLNEKKWFHSMFSLMLDPKFKTLGLRSFVLCSHLLVVNKERPSLENMIKNLCFSCFLSVTIICILWLNMKGVLLIKGLKRTIVWIFKKMIANTIEPSMKLINRELLIFKRYQVDVKDIKCPLQ
jgi:hypothetical protein